MWYMENPLHHWKHYVTFIHIHTIFQVLLHNIKRVRFYNTDEAFLNDQDILNQLKEAVNVGEILESEWPN